MNNTLEGIDSSITETEERINDLEVEITTTEQNIEWKEMKTALDTSGATLNAPTSTL